MAALTVRPAAPPDFDAWLPLWQGYNAFCGRAGPGALADEIARATWHRFLDDAEPTQALLALRADRLVGFAHYFFHRGTTELEPSCHLEDLFTAERPRRFRLGYIFSVATQRASEP